jgi:hypothetical protein
MMVRMQRMKESEDDEIVSKAAKLCRQGLFYWKNSYNITLVMKILEGMQNVFKHTFEELKGRGARKGKICREH